MTPATTACQPALYCALVLGLGVLQVIVCWSVCNWELMTSLHGLLRYLRYERGNWTASPVVPKGQGLNNTAGLAEFMAFTSWVLDA